MDAADCARIARELHESKGAAFVAVTEDGEKTLTSPKTKGRWDRLARLAVSLGASRIECRDEAGDVLAVVVVDDAPSVPVSSAPAPMSAQVTELAAMLRMVTESADRQVARFQEGTMATLASSLRMLDVVTRRVDSLETRQESSLRGRERDIEESHGALLRMGADLAQERAEVEAAIDATATKDPSQEMVVKLLEPLGLAIAARVTGA